jgi:transposase
MNAIGIDVSKGKSTVAILRPFGEIVAKPFEIQHTSSDIKSLINQLKTLNNDTRIVMEHTGRYYEPMAQWLTTAGFFVSAVNPKLIKDFGNNSLRKVKTDKADAVKIARYALDNWCELKQYDSMDELRNQLKNMNRQFDFYMKQKTAMKNNLIALLDQTFPGVNSLFDSPARSDGSQKWVDFISTFWHVDCVRKMSLSLFIDSYKAWCKRKGYNYQATKPVEIYSFSKDLIAMLPKDDITKMLLHQAIDQLNIASKNVEALRLLMDKTASSLPEYPIVLAMSGVGTTLGPQLIAEIGDVTRFSHKGALTAYAGVDPGANQSGTYEQQSVRTSKRGSPQLRKTLFMIMASLMKLAPCDDPVYEFMSRKRSQGKGYYVYMTAGANKFLRIYYGRVNEYLTSLPQSK